MTNDITLRRPLRGPALSEEIRTYIKNHILSNRLQPGDSLPPESQLMADLGVGRSSVREAVKALQSLGIVEVHRGNGLYVRQANFDPVLESLSYNMRFDSRIFAEVLAIRVWLESAVIEDAVVRISDEDIERLEDVLHMWEQQIALAQPHAALDQQFHDILYVRLCTFFGTLTSG
jgi:DNA-binding FadR family transcriptional regulator